MVLRGRLSVCLWSVPKACKRDKDWIVIARTVTFWVVFWWRVELGTHTSYCGYSNWPSSVDHQTLCIRSFWWCFGGVLTGTLKNPTKCLWRWEPDRRSNFFIPPAHLCAVTYITEISLHVTLSNRSNSNSISNLVACYHFTFRRTESDLFLFLLWQEDDTYWFLKVRVQRLRSHT